MLTVLAAALATQLSLMPTEAPPRWSLLDQSLPGFGSDGAPEPFAMRTMAMQALASLGGAALFGAGGYFLNRALIRASGGSTDYFAAFPGALIGVPLGFALGVWGTGKSFGHSGSFAATLLSSVLILPLNLVPLLLPVLWVVTVPLTIASVIGAYHLTDKAYRRHVGESPVAARPDERRSVEVVRPGVSLLRVAF